VTNSPTAQVVSVKHPIQAHVEAPDAGNSKSYGDVIQEQISQNSNPSTVVDTTVEASRESSPPKTSPPAANSVEPSHLYMQQMRERLYQSFSNYEHVDANVPPGNSAEMWFDVNRDGSVSNVRVGKPSGWDSLDYACMRAVQRTETVGALPEEYTLRTLPATFACTYTGSNALQTSKPVDSATDRPDVYVGSVRDTTHQ
jgi:TonB family protein